MKMKIIIPSGNEGRNIENPMKKNGRKRTNSESVK
jgi:hypothetical protein